MTKFIAYYNLCPIHDPKEFLGISPDKNQCSIIATISRNMILVIKIATQKQVSSWSVLEKLSSKVVFDHDSQQYVAVFGNRFLRCWSADTTDINKIKKLKFRKSIANLVTLGREKSTFVLYSDGSCESLQMALQNRTADSNAAKDRDMTTAARTFSSPKVSELPDGRYVLTYFDRNTTNNTLELIRTDLSDGKSMRFKLEREINGVTIAGWAIIDGKEAPTLLTLWSDKRMFLLNLNDSVHPASSPGNYVSMLNDLKLDTPLSILGLSSNFVAIYGANTGQEGASLLLYNTQFKVIKTKQFFKVYFKFSRLWEVDDHILLAMGQNLSVVSYHISKELLADLVGTQANEINAQQHTIEMDHINEDDLLQECIQYDGRIVGGNVVKAREQTAIRDSNRTQKPSNAKELAFKPVHIFNDTLAAIDRLQLEVQVVAVEGHIHDDRVTILPNVESGWSTALPHVQIIAQQLERSGASEHEIVEKVLTLLIEANLLEDIGAALQRYTSIPERSIAKTLHYLLGRLLEDDQQEAVSNVLRVLLSCPFQARTLAIHTRQELNYAHIVLLLEFLYTELTTDVEMAERSYVIEPPVVNVERQLLRWFDVCVDTCFQELAISKDPQLMQLITKWQQLVAGYKQEAGMSCQVLALLYSLVERRRGVSKKDSSKWYSIEEVTLF